MFVHFSYVEKTTTNEKMELYTRSVTISLESNEIEIGLTIY